MRSTNTRSRAAAVLALVVSVIVGLTLVFSLNQTPTYEATVKMLVSQKAPRNCFREVCLLLTNGSGGFQGLQEIASTVAKVVRSESVARATVEQLNLPGLSAQEVQANMTVEPEPGTMFINVSYRDSVPHRAQLIANTIAEVGSRKISDVTLGANGMIAVTATVWAPAKLPQNPVSPTPVRNMLLALATWGLLLGLLITARAYAGRITLRLPQTDVSLEVNKEQELLEALGRSPSGELTTAGAALETSLTVEEADRMLFRLAAKGYLQVRTREGSGGVFYSFWQRS